ncbi:hypothetical protein HNQ77_002674 [Silvibacterium bohemicum]|uniref:Uncharacterized protein n=1 Tax=Silvibacterium bohemicum TaxID=1577686 RepID=A0A841K245_9BACT|nr:hypothetical protein [Silvibacterium bohemicum]MBB6144718.1 hypothetical protein [Silvibacterium bohemicum]
MKQKGTWLHIDEKPVAEIASFDLHGSTIILSGHSEFGDPPVAGNELRSMLISIHRGGWRRLKVLVSLFSQDINGWTLHLEPPSRS